MQNAIALAFVNEAVPTAVLLDPVVLVAMAFRPTAVLFDPVVFAPSAARPTAELLAPVVLASSAPEPMAVRLSAVVMSVPAFSPIRVLFVPPDWSEAPAPLPTTVLLVGAAGVPVGTMLPLTDMLPSTVTFWKVGFLPNTPPFDLSMFFPQQSVADANSGSAFRCMYAWQNGFVPFMS